MRNFSNEAGNTYPYDCCQCKCKARNEIRVFRSLIYGSKYGVVVTPNLASNYTFVRSGAIISQTVSAAMSGVWAVDVMHEQ